MKLRLLKSGWVPLAVAGMACALVLGLVASAPADARGPTGLVGRWDRLNPDQSNPTPEHEVLRCSGNASPTCVYDKHPEPRLGFETPPDSTFGRFRGEEITVGWECPAWFPDGVCEGANFVAGGEMNLALSDGSQLSVYQELVVTEIDGVDALYVYWADWGFACPWFRGFDEALAANPFPTPFNGEDWPADDCFSP